MNRDVVLREWRKALQTSGAAKLLARQGFAEDTVSRAYYAIFHAAKAALAVCEVVTYSHSGAIRMFGLHLIRSGAIEPEWAEDLGESKDDRMAQTTT